MKKQFLTLSILSFALFSCSNEDEVQSQQMEETPDTELKNIAKSAKEISVEELERKFLKENNYILNSVNVYDLLQINNTQIHGPFNITISSVPTSTESNKLVGWLGYEYPVSVAYYVCDIHTHSVTIELPVGAVGFVNSMTNQAYNNWSEQTQGYASSNYTMNGKNYLLIKTYTMKLKWNMAGQTINAFVPYYGWGDKSVSYSYIIP